MKLTISSMVLVAALLISGQCTAQTKIIKSDGHFNKKMEGNPFLLKELGAVIATEEGAMKVLNVMPPAERKDSYKDVDLRENDVVMMANGKRLSAVKELESIYEGLAVGSELKMGIKRKEEMHLISLKKADPKDLPAMQMKIVRGGADDGDDAATFPAVGVVLKMKGKDIVIDEMLPGETAVQKLDVKPGDAIVEINGKHCTSLEEYGDEFDAVAVGKNVRWTLRRGEKQHTVTFARPQPRMIIRREGQNK